MIHAIEFNGRLCRPDGSPAAPGAYDLCFGLCATSEGESVLWEELHPCVRVSDGGGYHVVLGQIESLNPDLFETAPRYLSVRPVRDGRLGVELGERVAVSGLNVQMASAITRLEAAIDSVGALGQVVEVLLRRTRALRRHVRTLESGGGPVAALQARIDALEARLTRLDAEEGRVTNLEDELEDIVGPDGDVVDLTERMDALERRVRMIDRLNGLEQRLTGLEARVKSD